MKTYFDGLKKSTLLLLQKIQGKENQEEIDKINDFLFSLNEPKLFWGSEGVEVSFIKGFERICTIINQHIAKDPKQMTVLSFYGTLEILKEQFKTNKR